MDKERLERITDIGAAVAVWTLTALLVEVIAFVTWVWCLWL
jgi:hypothetical protein